jgi:hypothetical protein
MECPTRNQSRPAIAFEIQAENWHNHDLAGPQTEDTWVAWRSSVLGNLAKRDPANQKQHPIFTLDIRESPHGTFRRSNI